MNAAAPLVSRQRRVIRNLVLLGGGSGAASALALGAVAINSRALSLQEFGTYALMQSSALLVAGIFTFATQQPVIKLGMAALHADDRTRFERIVGMGLAADVASAVCAALVAGVAVLFMANLVGVPPSAKSAALIVAASLAFQGYRTSEGVLRAFDRFDALGVIQVGAAILQFGGAALLWWIDAPFVAYGVLAAIAIALPSIFQLAGALAIMRRRGMWPRAHGLTIPSADRREFAAYCGSTWATGSLDTIRLNSDVPLIGLLVSVEAAGIYNVARQLAGILRKFVQIYASVLFPELTSLAAQRNFAGARRVLRRIVLVTFAITATLVAGAALLGGIALGTLFGPEFRAGHAIVVLLFAAAGIQLLSATYSMYVQAFDGPMAILYAYIAATIAFALVIVPGLHALGLVGAGIAQIVFFTVLTLACHRRLSRAGAFNKDLP